LQPAFAQTSSPPKNKVQKTVLFLDPEKATVARPHLPRIPPQIHHDLPARNTPKTQKTPTKKAFPPQTIFFSPSPENSPPKIGALLQKLYWRQPHLSGD
jgi:hypothetical protein